MANINVRGISDKTKESLRVRAAKAGMSLEAYARRVLQKASLANGDEPKAVVDLAEKYFGVKYGVELDVPPRSTHRKPVELS
jgi:plasmid stability protein